MCSSRNSPVSMSRGRLSGRSTQSEFLRALMVIMRNMILFCSHITVNLFKLGFCLHSAANGGGNWRMFTSDLFLATLNQSKQRFSVMKCLAGESVGDFAIYRPARLPWRLMPACFVCWFSCNVDRLPHARDERLRKAMAAVSVWSGVFSSSGLFSFFLFFFPHKAFRWPRWMGTPHPGSENISPGCRIWKPVVLYCVTIVFLSVISSGLKLQDSFILLGATVIEEGLVSYLRAGILPVFKVCVQLKLNI